MIKGHSVELNHFRVLKVEVSYLYLVGHCLTDLAADGDVRDARFRDLRIIIVALRVETYLIIEKQDKLPLQPLLDILFLFTISVTFAHFKFHVDLLCFF